MKDLVEILKDADTLKEARKALRGKILKAIPIGTKFVTLENKNDYDIIRYTDHTLEAQAVYIFGTGICYVLDEHIKIDRDQISLYDH